MARTARQQGVFLVVFFGALLLVLAGVVVLGRHIGGGFGDACRQGDLFPCRNQGFNDARCLTERGSAGTCTHLCEGESDCPKGSTCRTAQWTTGRDGAQGGRVEKVCQSVR